MSQIELGNENVQLSEPQRKSTLSLRNVKDILITGRIGTSVIAGFTSFMLLATHDVHSVIWDMLRILPLIFTTMVGFILNDISDKEKDVLARKNRPIAKDSLSVSSARKAATILAFVAVALELSYADYVSSEILILTLFGVSVYSFLSRKIPLIKGFLTATFSCAPFVYGAHIASMSLPLGTYIACYLFILGRELLLDIRDIKSDRAFKLRTMAVYLSDSLGKLLAWSLMFSGLVLILARLDNSVAILLAYSGLLVLIVCVVGSVRNQQRSIGLTKVVFVLYAMVIALA